MNTPGPKPLAVSLYPLTPEIALGAFMRVDPKKVKHREKRWKGRKR